MYRRRMSRAVLAVLAMTAALAGLTGDTTCGLANAPSCRTSCLQEYNQCRLSTKGSPACDSQYQVCLQSCVVHR